MTFLRTGFGPAQVPPPQAEAKARAALLAHVRQVPQRPVRRPRWGRLGLRVSVAAGLAVVLAAGLIAVEGLGGMDRHGKPHPVIPGLPAAAPANAAEALRNAATAAANRRYTPPRPDQWMYFEFRDTSGTGPGGVVVGGPYQTQTERVWYRVDDQQMATLTNGKLVVRTQGQGARWVRSVPYQTLVNLPDDPAALLRWVDGKWGGVGGETRDGRDGIAFGVLNNFLRENVLPPRVEATIFRAIALLSGVTLVPDAVNVDGRPAIALGRVQDGWLREEILLEPHTYELIGERAIATKDHTVRAEDGSTRVAKGTVQRLLVRVKALIVDRSGQTG